MKLIVDQQLPPVLAGWLRSARLDAHQVYEIGLGEADDGDIWAAARRDDAVVVTKDIDFVDLFHSVGGARLVWVRCGNCSNDELLALFKANWDAVFRRLQRGDRFVELP